MQRNKQLFAFRNCMEFLLLFVVHLIVKSSKNVLLSLNYAVTFELHVDLLACQQGNQFIV